MAHKQKLMPSFQESLPLQDGPSQKPRSWKKPSHVKVKKEISYIKKHFQKAVPVFFETSSFAPSLEEKKSWFFKILKAPKGQHPYGFWNPRGGFLGISPEVFLDKKNKKVHTMALAGTSTLKEKDKLFNDPKERKEHEIVSQDIEARLKTLGKLQLSKPKVQQLGALAHLKTDISLVLEKDMPLKELIETLHPTPALGGAPRKKVLAYLEKQSCKRKAWGAPFGVWIAEEERFFSLVSIRNLRWDSDGVEIGSGCGVVAESCAEKELQELTMKRNWVKQALGLPL